MNPEQKKEGILKDQKPYLADVIVIDDEESMCEGCKQTLEAVGYRAAFARNGEDGLKLIETAHPYVVLVDLKMPGIPGTEVISRIPKIDATVVPIIITGYGTIDSAVESMKIGAFDFITKPFGPDKLLESVRRGIKLSELRKEQQIGDEREKAPKLDKHEVLLRGLTVLSESYSVDLPRQNFLDELKYLETEAKYHAQMLGQVKKEEKAILDVVQELRIVDEIVDRHNFQKNMLIQILLEIQATLRWLPRYVLKWVAARLDIPLADIMTITNFYEAFSLEPQGRHTIQVCLGTACHVRGAPELLTKVSAVLGIKPGQTDTTQTFTLNTVHCLGCCALAPVLKIDETYYSDPSLDEMKEIFKSYATQEELSWQK